MTVDPVWADDEEPIGEPEDGHPSERGSFVPSVRRPIPGQQCTATVKNGNHAGERCRRRAIYGHWICLVHGGGSPLVRRKAEAVVRAARMRLIDSTEMAMETIDDLMINATSEAVRLKAATEVLDRAGVRGGTEVDVTVREGQDPADLLRKRLEQLRANAMTIDGEVLHREDVTMLPSADEATQEEST